MAAVPKVGSYVEGAGTSEPFPGCDRDEVAGRPQMREEAMAGSHMTEMGMLLLLGTQ